jgi:sulfur-oxidizing protein SoxX
MKGSFMKKGTTALIAVACVAAIMAGCKCDAPSAAEQKGPIESPSAAKQLASDPLGAPVTFSMPQGCVTTDKEAIEEGKIFFNELNNKSGKYPQYSKDQEFGNCVACHQIEKANGYGNVGPDLTKYHENFIKSGGRTPAFVYQKIADPRIDNPETSMTVNLTTKLMTEKQICAIMSYIFSEK